AASAASRGPCAASPTPTAARGLAGPNGTSRNDPRRSSLRSPARVSPEPAARARDAGPAFGPTSPSNTLPGGGNLLVLFALSLDPKSLLETFGTLGLFAIIFAETGLLIGFFLPGDSLLFTAGLLCAPGVHDPVHLNLAIVLPGVFVAA